MAAACALFRLAFVGYDEAPVENKSLHTKLDGHGDPFFALGLWIAFGFYLNKPLHLISLDALPPPTYFA